MIALWLDGLPGLGSRSFDKQFVGLLGFVAIWSARQKEFHRATWKLSNHRPESSSLAKLRIRGSPIDAFGAVGDPPTGPGACDAGAESVGAQ